MHGWDYEELAQDRARDAKSLPKVESRPVMPATAGQDMKTAQDVNASIREDDFPGHLGARGL